MERRTKWTVLAGGITLLSFFCIQIYFLRTTYDLREKEIHSTVIGLFDSFEKGNELRLKGLDIESISEDLVYHFQQGQISKSTFEKSMIGLNPEYDEGYSKFLRKIQREHGYELTVRKTITNIYSYTEDTSKLLYSGAIPYFHFGEPFENERTFYSGVWKSSGYERSDTNHAKDKGYDHHIFSKSTYEIHNIRQLVFATMSLLVLTEIILSLFLCFIYYRSVRNLIRQSATIQQQKDLINNMTHEFKTPLATLKVAAKSLTQFEPGSSAFTEMVPVIERQTSRLSQIVEQINYSAVEYESARKADESLVHHLIEDIKLSYPSIRIQADLAFNYPTIVAASHLTCVLENLLENSCKYGSDEIRVHVKSTESLLRISVGDNGKGIRKEEHRNIFLKYYRIGTGDTHTIRGLGLGLYFVQQIVDFYNGTLQVDSQENKGTLITITL